MKSRFDLVGLILLCMTIIPGCAEPNPSTPSTDSMKTLTLATTTSTQDSGLLDVLLPVFQKQTGIEVKVVAVGSGQALELGRRGDADLLLTHVPAAEEQFVAEGFARERIPVFHNDFVLVGPAGNLMDLETALKTIATQNLVFVSRGDDSGTHRKELELWKAMAIEPTFPNYLNAGSGMAMTLRIAAEKQGYTLSDRATYLATQSQLGLKMVSAGDSRLLNPYALMLIDPERHPHVRAENAERFMRFLREPGTRRLIGEFGRETYGQPLFFVD